MTKPDDAPEKQIHIYTSISPKKISAALGDAVLLTLWPLFQRFCNKEDPPITQIMRIPMRGNYFTLEITLKKWEPDPEDIIFEGYTDDMWYQEKDT